MNGSLKSLATCTAATAASTVGRNTTGMTPRDLLYRFVKLAPEFQAQWDSEHNDNRDDDGPLTLPGICSEFSQFFRTHHTTLSEQTHADLFDLIEWNVVGPDADETLVDNALCTCFLENISSEPCGEFAKPWMGRKTRAFFDLWHKGPPY